MEQIEFKIIEALKNRQDPIEIAKQFNIKLSTIIQVMQRNPDLIPKQYRDILDIEDRIEQIQIYMAKRKKIANSIPFTNIVVKLRMYLKKPHSSYDCIQYVKQPYRRLYAALKDVGVIRANALSPLSIDLLLSKRMSNKIDILRWRKTQIDETFAIHKRTMRQIGTEESDDFLPLYKLVGLNIYIDLLFLYDYNAFVSHIDFFFKSLDLCRSRFSPYQRELILGAVLRRKHIDLMGFPKDSIYYSDSPYYPLFILNNRVSDLTLEDIGSAMGWTETTSSEKMRRKTVEYAIENRAELPEVRNKITISMNKILDLFEGGLSSVVKDLCWGKTPIFMELVKFIIYYKEKYEPPDMMDLIFNKGILQGCNSFNESEIYSLVTKKMDSVLFDGFKKINKITFDDIIDSLFFNMERFPIAFYLLSRLNGIPTLEQHNKYYLARMKARQPTIYEQKFVGDID